MRKSEIENQLSNAERTEQDAINRYDEAKRSAEELMTKSKELVDERTRTLDKAKEEKNDANSVVGALTRSFQEAKRKLDKKCAEAKCTMNKMVHLRNCYQNYYDKYQRAHLETAHLEALLSNPSNTPAQKAHLNAQIRACKQSEDNLRHWMETSYGEICRLEGRLPKIEQEVKEFENLIEEIKPKLDEANRKLEEATEREKIANDLLHDAKAIMEHNQELGQAKLREAEAEKEKAQMLVSNWKSALAAAEIALIDYNNRQYD